MRVYGIDFTSSPRRSKPITCLACDLEGDVLTSGTLHEWRSFEGFEAALREPGPWIAGIDFPFGMARRFIETIGWPATWQATSITSERSREETSGKNWMTIRRRDQTDTRNIGEQRISRPGPLARKSFTSRRSA